LNKGAGTIEKNCSTIDSRCFKSKIRNGVPGVFPAPPPPAALFGGEGPAQLKIIAGKSSTIGAQLITPILDPQLEMGGGQEDGPLIQYSVTDSNTRRNIFIGFLFVENN